MEYGSSIPGNTLKCRQSVCQQWQKCLTLTLIRFDMKVVIVRDDNEGRPENNSFELPFKRLFQAMSVFRSESQLT